ncbi:MAG: glycosyltransferase [Bacteroidetes bacterium]|nr:glycosyltransferase [Bacteroidota bacterium]
MIFIEILFWVSVYCLVHSYIIYPLILHVFSALKKTPKSFEIATSVDNVVSIIMAVHNEETVIENKIRSVFDTDYEGVVEMIIGSDASTDATNEIIKKLQLEFPGKIKAFFYTERQGKPELVNMLKTKTDNEILILTDANVYFEKSTIRNLVSHFSDPSIGIVGANIINLVTNKDGISIQEKMFIKGEILMKHYEGKLWGSMIGAFGGCYAIRKSLLPDVPDGFAVEDFFITLSVLKQKQKAITDLKALVYEDVSNDWRIEYKRKVRISAGNFQNLKYFISLLWPPYKGVSFAFMSHKVIRWFGPFFIIFALISNIALATTNTFYLILLISQGLLYAIFFIDFLLKKLNIHIVLLRFVSHFFTMNLALLEGFFKFLKGENTNVWQPTKRNQ